MSAIAVRDLAVACAGRRLFDPVSFDLPTGSSLGLRGPSGAGKSTILRALVGLLPPGLSAKGQISVLGVDVLGSPCDLPALRARAVLVGQTPVVFPASILANATFGVRHVVRASKTELQDRAEAALKEAGLWEEVAGRLDHPADELSVGQRQRLCLARALALDPPLLLLDEPTSALDSASTAKVESALAALAGSRSLLVVSHDGGQLARLCSGVVSLAEPPPPGPEEAGEEEAALV